MLLILTAALAGFSISFCLWRWVLGDRNLLEGIIVSIPLAVILALLAPAYDKVKDAAERAAARQDTSEAIEPPAD